jgi:DDE superfamily endonuclease
LLPLPPLFVSLLNTFAPLFSDRVWRQAQVLLIGALLAPGQRTVTSCLRIVGLGRERRFANYHRVLSRARGQGRAASRLLLGLLVQRFVPTGPIVLGIDDTIERRRGKRIHSTITECHSFGTVDLSRHRDRSPPCPAWTNPGGALSPFPARFPPTRGCSPGWAAPFHSADCH